MWTSRRTLRWRPGPVTGHARPRQPNRGRLPAPTARSAPLELPFRAGHNIGSPGLLFAPEESGRRTGVMGNAHIFDLEQPRTAEMPIHAAPQQAGYSYLLHRHRGEGDRPEEAGPRTGAAGVIICGEHTGTHIDALCHQSDALVLYGGVSVEDVQSSRGFTVRGVEEIPPIVAPGVLLDVAAKEGGESPEPGPGGTAGDRGACCREA